MEWIWLGAVVIALGVTLGALLQAWLLAVITVAILIIAVYVGTHLDQHTSGGEASLISLMYAIVMITAMWTVFYINSGQTFLGVFLRTYILQ